MKRRDFFAAAGLGAGSMLTVTAGPIVAAEDEERPPEKFLQIYKCVRCGSIVQIMHPGKPTLVHCGVPMTLLVEKTEDTGYEKHVPVIEKIDGGYKVKVGSVPHPMIETHYIVLVQLIADGSVQTKALEPGDEPEAVFLTDAQEVVARAYCNLHGLWKSK
ncbi:MAG TPA: desulfoferrodoxin [Thermoguttaceae bacterium]|nr:desulfoferrodoxin [Thermoguttaceae bacterium]